MIIPGTIRPMMMQSGKADPFSYSGSWETGDEGWSRSFQVDYRSNNARTGTYCFGSNDVGATADYVLAAGVCKGLNLSVAVYHKSATGSSYTVAIQVKIGAGSFSTIASVTSTATSYGSALQGELSISSDEAVTVRLLWQSLSSNTIFLDDWSISGS